MAAAAPYPSFGRRASSRLEAFASRLLDEFALHPHRVRSAVRAAGISALGAGIMAAAHIDSDLGPYLVWAVAGTPTAMLSWRRALGALVVLAALISGAVVLARTLCQSPPLMLLFFGGFGFGSTWLIARYKLGALGLVGQVLVFDIFYGTIFAPAKIGWNAAYGFGGVAVAIALLVLFDNMLWPDPAEGVLLESLAANLLSIRRRVLDSGDYYLDPHRAHRAPRVINWRDLNSRLTLLARARAEGISEHRRGVLLALITRTARIEAESEILALIALEAPIDPGARAVLLREIEAVVDAIGTALADFASTPTAMLGAGPDGPPEPSAARAQSAVVALNQAVEQRRGDYVAVINAAELSRLSSFLSGLRMIVRLIERPLDEPAAQVEGGGIAVEPDRRGLAKYAMKVGVAVVAAYIVGLTSHRPDMATIMTTVLISGLPTYGAARRKMNLRIIGAIVGGLITVAAIIITTPNFETVLSYMLVSAAVLFISSYAGQGSENIAYAGKQIGTTYTLVFVGLSPATDITAPLWRTWGILLGSIIVGVVFLLLWPEYSGKSLLPRLRRALEIVVGLAPRTDLDAIDIRRRDAELANLLEELLSIAEDARMEGRASDLDPDAVIGAAGSLRRIAHRFARIGLLRLEHPRPPLDAVSETLEAGAINAMIGRLAAWQADFARPDCLERPTDASEQRADSEIGELLDRFSERLESNNFACLADWQSEARRTVLAELQSLRRLDFLIEELGRQLHRVRRAAAGPVI